jgi:5'(3')-deoxyribonucleotidase
MSDNNKKILYIDLDGVIVDFNSSINKLSNKHKLKYSDRYDEAPGIFKLMEPIPGAIKAVKELSSHYDVFILSTAPWNNHGAWSDKIKWVKKHFGQNADNIFYKKMILSPRKDLNLGDILIDDRTKNGADQFRGELILFGSEKFSNWDVVIDYLINT